MEGPDVLVHYTTTTQLHSTTHHTLTTNPNTTIHVCVHKMLMRINSVRDQMGIEMMYIYMYMYMCIYMYMTVWCMHVGFHTRKGGRKITRI